MRYLRSSKFLKTTVKLTFTIQKANLFCFQLKIAFLGKVGPKTQNCQFKLKFCI